MAKKKLLITGASGFLGYHLMRVAAPQYELVGISHAHLIGFNQVLAVKADITNYIEIGNLFEDIEPDAVIHAAAKSDANYCEQHKEISYAVNVDAARNLAGICSDYKIPFAFTSTDLVFDGKKGMYQEQDEKNPLSVYGEQKSMAEDEVLKIYPDTNVFRLPLLFGYPNASAGNYLHKLMQQVKHGEPVNLFFDEYRSICSARSISEGILRLMFESHGTTHLAGRQKLSRYDFGLLAADAFSMDKNLLNSCSQKDVKMAAPRPADVSLNISKALALGFDPADVATALKDIAHSKYV